MSCYCNFICSEENMYHMKLIYKKCCIYCIYQKNNKKLLNNSFCNYCYRSHYLEHKYFLLWKRKIDFNLI